MSDQTIVIDLAARYAAAFGMMAINNRFNAASVNQYNQDYSFDLYPTAANHEKTELIYNNQKLVFSGMLSGDIPGVFAPPIILEFSREKDLIETKVNGSDNVVIERWGTKPWDIDMRGILVDMNDKIYPKNLIEQLHEFFEINDIIEVEGLQFEDKKIDSIYFKSVKITPVEGYPDTIQYTMTASSIQPVEFNVFKR